MSKSSRSTTTSSHAKKRLLVALFALTVIAHLILQQTSILEQTLMWARSIGWESLSAKAAEEVEENYPWIKDIVASSPAPHECVNLTHYASKVVRVSLHEFLHDNSNSASGGRPFLPLFHYIKTHYDETNWLASIATEAVRFNNVRGVPGCQAYGLHNYKAGGTTLSRAKIAGKRAWGDKDWPRVAPLKDIAMSQQQQHQQQQLGTTNTTSSSVLGEEKFKYATRVFSFVRDPVAKFVSAVRQVILLGRCNDCKRCVRPAKGNSTTLMSCILDQMQTNRSYLDRHLSPQVYTLYHSQRMHADIHIDLMNLQDMSHVLVHALGKDPNETTVENANPGSARRFNFTGVQDLTPDLVRRICSMYEVDLRLLRTTKLVEATICDDPRYLLDGSSGTGREDPWIPNLDGDNATWVPK